MARHGMLRHLILRSFMAAEAACSARGMIFELVRPDERAQAI